MASGGFFNDVREGGEKGTFNKGENQFGLGVLLVSEEPGMPLRGSRRSHLYTLRRGNTEDET